MSEQTTDPRVAAVVARMRGWNCFEPLRPGAIEELAVEVVAACDAADAEADPRIVRIDWESLHAAR